MNWTPGHWFRVVQQFKYESVRSNGDAKGSNASCIEERRMAGSSVGREVLPSLMSIHLLGTGSTSGGVRPKTEPEVFEPASAGRR